MRQTSLCHLARGACLAVLALVAHARPATVLARLTISLAPGNETLLPRTVRELSDPTHSRYGKHLSREEALDLLQPSPEALTAVTTWLRDVVDVAHEDIQQRGQFLHAAVSPGQVAVLRKRQEDTAEGLSGVHIVTEEAVRRHIRAVYLEGPEANIGARWQSSQTNHSAAPSPADGKHAAESSLDACHDKLTPACLREQYKMKDIPPTSKKTILGIIGFGNQAAQHTDLDLFFKNIDPSRARLNFTEAFLNGGANPQGNFSSGEANLDIQYAVALAGTNVDVRFLSVGGWNTDIIPDLDLPAGGLTEPYLPFVTALAALPAAELPSVISISYGINEQLLPRAYAAHVCDIFGQLAARGVSVLVASGDAGPGQSCQANDGSGRDRFLPMFPASCPYVTAVGGTRFAGAASGEEETTLGMSGGGFSEYFPRPGYQRGAVESYLAKHGKLWEGLFNPQGRGIPDVAALGEKYQIYNHGNVENTGGTSASTPVFAAMIAVLNGLRAEKGKQPLGFLNPWLYTFGRFGLTDITTGNSTGCPGISYAHMPSPHIVDAGWPADHGWDAATGLGTPIFSRLRSLACLSNGREGHGDADGELLAGLRVGVRKGDEMK